MGRVVAARGEGVARGSGGVGCAAVRSGVVVAAGGALAARVPGDGPAGDRSGSSDDRARDVRQVDGAQAALSVGVPVVGGGGVGLDSSAQVLPDLALRAGAGRVDGPQADPADRRGDGVGDNTCVDRGGLQGEAVSAAGGEDRLDRDRGGCQVSDRRGVGVERGPGVGARGPQASQVDQAEEGAVAGRSRAMGHKLRTITRTIRRRSARPSRKSSS